MTKNNKAQATALVTGGAKRIGKSLCLALASQGYTIALHYHHSSREAKKTADMIRHKGGQCELFDCDLTNQRKAEQLIPRVLKKCSRLDALINNASIFEPSTIKTSNTSLLNRHFSINFNAPYILTASFSKKCRRGNVINILDTHITHAKTRHAAYLLSKKALYELTKLSAIELAPHIRVNAVAPGLILPPEGKSAAYVNKRAKTIPLKTKGSVNQIAESVTFLLNNPYLTGQIIFNDGGEHLV